MTTLNWLTLNEVADRLGVHYMKVYRLVTEKQEIPAEKKGGVWLVLDRDLDQWLRQRAVRS